MTIVVMNSLSQYAYYVQSRTEGFYLIENVKTIASDEYNAKFVFLIDNKLDSLFTSCYLRSSSLSFISLPPSKFLKSLPVDGRMKHVVKVVQADTYARNKTVELSDVNKDILKRRIEVDEVVPSSYANRDIFCACLFEKFYAFFVIF